MKTILKRQSYTLLLNKHILLIFLSSLSYIAAATAQLRFSINSSNNYLGVYTYAGYISNNAYELKFEYNGANLNVPNWRISARLTSPILEVNGNNVFPADKISFIPTNVQGNAQPLPTPTISQIGIPSSIPLNATSEVFIVPRSNAPLYYINQNPNYFFLQLSFNLEIAAGAYLGELQGGYTQKKYIMNLEFTAYGSNNEVINKERKSYTIDVFKLSGTPISTNKYSIQVTGGAQNGYLELRTIDHYMNGNSVSYNNALKLSTNIDYQVTAYSIPAQFSSTSGYNLPLSTINVLATPTDPNSVYSVKPIELSTIPQTIIDGRSTKEVPIFFDIKYFTKPNNKDLIKAKPDEYSTNLIYEILPK